MLILRRSPLLFFLALPAICLFSPDVYGTMTALLRTGALPLTLLATIAWGVMITWAFFREGLGLSRRRAASKPSRLRKPRSVRAPANGCVRRKTSMHFIFRWPASLATRGRK